MKKLYFIIFLFCTGIFSTVSAQDSYTESITESDSTDIFSLSLEELMNIQVESSSLIDVKKFQESGKSYVYSQSEMNSMGMYSTGEIFNYIVPGTNIGYHPRTAELIGVRGMMIDANSKSMALRDNVNMNIRVHYGTTGGDLSSPLNGDINKLEFMLGPGALQHGSGAINGYYNLVTHTGETAEGIKANVSYSSGNTRVAEVSYGLAKEKGNLFVYGGYHQSDGVEFDTKLPLEDYPNIPTDEYMENARIGTTVPNYKFSMRYMYGNESDLVNLDLSALLSKTSTSSQNMSIGHNAEQSWEESVRTMAKADQTPFHTFNHDVLSVTPKMKFNFNETNKLVITPNLQINAAGLYTTKFMEDLIEEYEIGEKDYQKGMGEEYLYTSKVTFINSSIDKLKIALGGQAGTRDFKQLSEFFYDDPGEGVFGVNTGSSEMSGFGEVLLDLEPFTISGGLRYDYWTITDAQVKQMDKVNIELSDNDIFTGRIHAAYKIGPTQFVKAVYQQGYRFPEAYFTPINYWNVDRGVMPELRKVGPESMDNIELHFETGIGENVLFATNAVYNIYENTLGWSTPAVGFVNSDKVFKSISSETNLMYKKEKINLNLSYSFTKPLDSYETDMRLANADDTWTRFPSHMFKFYGMYKAGDLTFAAVSRLRSGAYDNDVNDAGELNISDEYREIAEKWALQNSVHISYDWKDMLQFYTKVSHITNDYQPLNFFRGMQPLRTGFRPKGPTFGVGVRYTM